jgi:hypothetical protein
MWFPRYWQITMWLEFLMFLIWFFLFSWFISVAFGGISNQIHLVSAFRITKGEFWRNIWMVVVVAVLLFQFQSYHYVGSRFIEKIVHLRLYQILWFPCSSRMSQNCGSKYLESILVLIHIMHAWFLGSIIWWKIWFPANSTKSKWFVLLCWFWSLSDLVYLCFLK